MAANRHGLQVVVYTSRPGRSHSPHRWARGSRSTCRKWDSQAGPPWHRLKFR